MDRRGGARPRRLALFLLKDGLVSGAVLDGKLLPADQALQLWAGWAWLPAGPGQPWPADPPGAALQEGQGLAPQW